MTNLKLVALDEVDLEVLSAHMQDAILRVENISWNPGSHRFVALMNRFDWEQASSTITGTKSYERHLCSLRFDCVKSIQLKNIEIGNRDTPLSLLTIRFQPDDEPSGKIELIFADDCAIRLNVECIEAKLADHGAGWSVRLKPEHEG